MKGVQTRKTLDFIGLPSFPSVRCSPEGCSGGVHAILNTGVHGGVQGCSRVQGSPIKKYPVVSQKCNQRNDSLKTVILSRIVNIPGGQ